MHGPELSRRPDDFSVVMALGDSITAGLLAKSTRRQGLSLPLTSHDQIPMQPEPVRGIAEDRGVSYAIGNDPGAITIPSILSHYTPNLVGVSLGSRKPILRVGG